MKRTLVSSVAFLFLGLGTAAIADPPKPSLQYDSDDIKIAAATEDEPRVRSFNAQTIQAASKYLDDGAVAWVEQRTCVACHTSGVYMSERPSLTGLLGKPQESVRQNFLEAIPSKIPDPKTDRGVTYYPAADRAVWRSVGLAEWDKHVLGKLSSDTERSLRDMLLLQSSHGGYHVVGEVEVPYVTSDFSLSLQAARAIATAPGWLASLQDEDLIGRIERLKSFLLEEKLRNDYDRVQRLQLAIWMPELVGTDEVEKMIALLWGKQLPDGGWSTRRMSDTMSWHVSVSDKVKTLIENLPDASAPESDPYMTAFAIVLLRQSGIATADPRIQRAVAWMKREQRESGRWWMHSLYRGNYHFTTYIATAQAMKALALCEELH